MGVSGHVAVSSWNSYTERPALYIARGAGGGDISHKGVVTTEVFISRRVHDYRIALRGGAGSKSESPRPDRGNWSEGTDIRHWYVGV